MTTSSQPAPAATPARENEEPPVSLSFSAPASALAGRSILSILLGVGSVGALGGGLAGYASGGFSAEQRLELVQNEVALREEFAARIQSVQSEVRDESAYLRDQIAGVRSEVDYLRGKLNLEPRTTSMSPSPAEPVE